MYVVCMYVRICDTFFEAVQVAKMFSASCLHLVIFHTRTHAHPHSETVGAEKFNAPVGMLKTQPSQLEDDLPFEPVTLTFRYVYLRPLFFARGQKCNEPRKGATYVRTLSPFPCWPPRAPSQSLENPFYSSAYMLVPTKCGKPVGRLLRPPNLWRPADTATCPTACRTRRATATWHSLRAFPAFASPGRYDAIDATDGKRAGFIGNHDTAVGV